MEPPPPPPEAVRARALAQRFVNDLRLASADALRPHGLDIAPAMEQVLYHALQDPASLAARRSAEMRAGLARLARTLRAMASVRRGPPLAPTDVLVVLLTGVHARLFDPVEAKLFGRPDPVRIVRVTAGHASRDPRLAMLPGIADRPSSRTRRAFLETGFDADRLREATASWADTIGAAQSAALRLAVADAAVRLGIAALRLDATLEEAQPRVAVIYDEIDAWGRLLCAVASRRNVPVVDLPHAEAVAIEAIRGARYDAMGAYGPRAARVLAAAGVASDRIEVVGPARFDALVTRARTPMEVPPRVVMAAQPRGRAMTDQLRSAILSAAAAASSAIGGSLEIVPHPTEPASSWQPLVGGVHAPDGRIVRDAGLHDLLPGAAMLVTGWSNSVYEAVLSGVPAMTVHPGPGEAPMPFAREGISTEARGAADAAAIAARIVTEEGRSTALARARSALTDHLGPLDGRAAARSADLVGRFLQP